MLAPKITVAITTIIATVVPRIVERTGGPAASVPGSRANRMPITAEVGAPTDAAASATLDARRVGRRRPSARCGADRTAYVRVNVVKTSEITSIPKPSTVQ